MARTVAEIKKTMTDAFLANETLREKYGLSSSSTWTNSFSPVSLENIIIYIVATAFYVLERLFDQYLVDVAEKVDGAVVASVPWYHKVALAYQKGYDLILNETTQRYEYARIDESKQIVKYAAVRDRGTSVQILVSGDNNGNPVALSNDDLTPFKYYMNRVKVAGVILKITSKDSTRISVAATIYVDPLVINSKGESLSDGSKPVELAIANHFKSILYGGIFNKTKLVDAIQAVNGVVDVELGECKYQEADQIASPMSVISGNNYDGEAGSYVPVGLDTSLNYVVQS